MPTCRSVWDDYEADTELIGRGAFARVFKALRRTDQEPVAIKVIGRDTKAFSQQRRGGLTNTLLHVHTWGSQLAGLSRHQPF